jgi:lysophospholipid acyltransferase (LPLAT)-like uncharacterized protein
MLARKDERQLKNVYAKWKRPVKQTTWDKKNKRRPGVLFGKLDKQ